MAYFDIPYKIDMNNIVVVLFDIIGLQFEFYWIYVFENQRGGGVTRYFSSL